MSPKVKEKRINVSKLFNERIKKEDSLGFIKVLLHERPELELYLVGGMVRDILLNAPNSKDFDFVARNVEIKDLIVTLNTLGWCDLTGRDFGVIKFKPKDSTGFIDIALPRSEKAQMTGGYRDFSLQVDKKLPLEKDLARRDLTINALAWDIKHNQLIDPFKGQEDLSNKIIRAVGAPEKRFAEDFSRILRALRFACQFNFKFDSKTWAALVELAPNLIKKRTLTKHEHLQRRLAQEIVEEERQKLLEQLISLKEEGKRQTIEEDIVPHETLAKELFKTLVANPVQALDLYDKSGLLQLILPEVQTLKGCTQPEKFHSEGDVWTHTLMMLEKIEDLEFKELFPSLKITGDFILGCILHDIGKPATRTIDETVSPPKIKFYGHAEEGVAIAKSICARLKLSRESQEKISFMIKEHMFVMSAPDIKKFRAHTFAERYIDSPYSTELLALFYLDVTCSLRPDGSADYKNFEETLQRIDEIKMTRSRQPKKIVDGAQIIEILNIEAGPFISCLIELIAELKDQGKINRPGDAEKFLRDNSVTLKKIHQENHVHNHHECVEKILKILNV